MNNVGHDWLVGSTPPAYINRRIGHPDVRSAAVLVRTETVEGIAVPLYFSSNSPDQPWPALSAVRALLNGATYPVIEGGMGISKVRGPAGEIAIASPQATAAALRRALRDGHITPERATAIAAAVGETS